MSHSDAGPAPHDRISHLLNACHEAQQAQRDVLVALTRDAPQENWEAWRPTLRLLLSYILERGHAALRLIAMRQDFDAEILLRTFHEGAAKLMLIALTPEPSRPDILGEYWSALGEVSDRKTAHRAGLAEAVVPGSDADGRDTLRVLQSAQRTKAAKPLDRQERRRLQQKWSLPEVLRSLDHLLGSGKSEAAALLHMYGMSSHLAHADCRALELALDRHLRSPQERASLEDAHAARMISDVAQIGAYCTLLAAEHARLPDLERAAAAAKAVEDEASVIMGEFNASQRAFNQSILGASSA